MGGATQAGIKGPDHSLEAIDSRFGQGCAMNEMSGHLKHSPIHGQVIVTGGNDQVQTAHEPVFIHLVMMKQGSPRSLNHADALGKIRFCNRTDPPPSILSSFSSASNTSRQ